MKDGLVVYPSFGQSFLNRDRFGYQEASREPSGWDVSCGRAPHLWFPRGPKQGTVGGWHGGIPSLSFIQSMKKPHSQTWGVEHEKCGRLWLILPVSFGQDATNHRIQIILNNWWLYRCIFILGHWHHLTIIVCEFSYPKFAGFAQWPCMAQPPPRNAPMLRNSRFKRRREFSSDRSKVGYILVFVIQL